MKTSFLVVSIAEDGHEVEEHEVEEHEVEEHECDSYQAAEKEAESYSCPIRIYAKVPINAFAAREGFGRRAKKSTKDDMRQEGSVTVLASVELSLEAWVTLALEGIRMAGSIDAAEVLTFIEESLTPAQVQQVTDFLQWLKKNGLSVGHGTIPLRWDEFKSKRAPVGQEEAYQWAIKRAGV